MITYIKNELYGEKQRIEIACKSTDSKPTTGIVTGSMALEVDTGDIYAFDEAGAAWNKING